MFPCKVIVPLQCFKFLYRTVTYNEIVRMTRSPRSPFKVIELQEVITSSLLHNLHLLKRVCPYYLQPARIQVQRTCKVLKQEQQTQLAYCQHQRWYTRFARTGLPRSRSSRRCLQQYHRHNPGNLMRRDRD